MSFKDDLKVDLNKNKENHKENFVKKFNYKDRKEFIQEESIIVGRSERNESLQYYMAIQCILEEYEEQQDRINKAIEYIEIIKKTM